MSMVAEDEMRSEHESAELGYRIGTVAQLTGLDPHTIRAWERRYGAIQPLRTPGGTRSYADAEVARLRLIKGLIDCGDPISHVAGLSDDELRARLAKLAGQPAAALGPAPGPERSLRVAILDPALCDAAAAQQLARRGLEVAAAAADEASFRAAVSGRPLDLLVLAWECLGADPLAALERCRESSGARLAIVTYGFARRRDLARLARADARLLRGPLGLAQLGTAIRDLFRIDRARDERAATAYPAPGCATPAEGGTAPQPRFSEGELARLREVASSVGCECPNHLSSLVSSLGAFERYSRECASRSPEEAALHARLANRTGEARGLVERLLAEVCEQEGIALASPPSARRRSR